KDHRINNIAKVSFEDSIGEVPARQWYLCDKMTDKFYRTPNNLEERNSFLKRIIRLRPIDDNRIAKLINNGRCAYFCHSHLATRKMS
ncbi:hypothetical protein PMAYCL1PPCAC_01637, partial [Pristionchus mayeri]